MKDDNPACPHCGHEINMNDSDIYCAHTTYWGEGGPRPQDCPECEKSFYVREHVMRTWHVGMTPSAAEEAIWND